MSVHSEFILTPISEILFNAVSVTLPVSRGIAMYPLWDYVMQSVFIKMTGAQEQKMKCVCWEIATVDYERRWKIYYEQGWKLGECSQLDAKVKVIHWLNDTIKWMNKDFKQDDDIKEDIWNRVKDNMEKVHSDLNRMGFCDREYLEFDDMLKNFTSSCLDFSSFFYCSKCKNKTSCCKQHKQENSGKLLIMYDHLYRFRNRCAHNLTSYQQNLPALSSLSDNDYCFENYYIRFALLIIIDEITIYLFKEFTRLLSTRLL
ncbi:MAG: hypothetical protein LUE27_10010 [Clostridia bacterium]|nr:hypothetical protein [Clostridia bacterium]